MSNEKWTRGEERTGPLDLVFQPGLGGKEERERESRRREIEKDRVLEREAPPSL